MGFQTAIDRVLLKLVRDHAGSHLLRRRFKRLYGMEVGLQTIGAFDRWRLSENTRFGRYCSIAASARIIDANHPTDALSTHPSFYLKGWGVVEDNHVNAEPTIIEDDVWLGHNAILTPGCKHVGRGAVIGAGAVVMRDVPAYAVMSGSPAKLMRFRFAPDVIEAVEATRWWELEPAELGRTARAVPGFLQRPTVEGAQLFLEALGRPRFTPKATAEPASFGGASATPNGGNVDIVSIIQREIAEFSASDLDTPLGDLPIDSFGLVTLRGMIESACGRQISDHIWGAVRTPRDMQAIVSGAPAHPQPEASPPAALLQPSADDIPKQTIAPSAPGTERRNYTINMPQMALEGLSESWLFKEIGDIHWHNITTSLGTRSSDIADDTGSRLYATFTRFLLRNEAPLKQFRENEPLSIDMSASRLGAGMFFGTAEFATKDARGHAQVMTSFAKFGEHGRNTSLLKGQPVIPEGCPIPTLAEMPSFAVEYRERRALQWPEPLFETDYTIQPPHDINGVGLLYFAAYPMIADLGAIKYAGNRYASAFSTVERDICYFANCGPDATLIFRLLRWDEDESGIVAEATLARQDDGVVMAHIITKKQRTA